MRLSAPGRRLDCTALVLLLSLVACHAADPAPGPPNRVVAATGNNQQGTVGVVLPTPPTVRVEDSRGTAVPGVMLHFSVTAGGGHLAIDSALTNSAGTATVDSWVLGTAPGTNTVLATVATSGISGTVTATAVAGPPAAVRIVGAQLFTALTGQSITPPPTVLVVDSYNNPVIGTPVTFTITSNNGSVAGGTVPTNAQGQAQVGAWTLGTSPGTNGLTASTSNGVAAFFQGNGLAAPPNLTSTTPTEQSGYLSFPITQIPRVKVTDANGNPLANVTVAFAVSGTDATLSGTLVATGTDGIAAPADWRLGPTGASSTVTATLPNFAGASLSFHATGVASPFTIDLRFLTSMSADSRDAFVAAARRWMSIISADIPDQALTLAAGACATGQPAVNETVDDVIIYASVVPIDGPGNVLGSAGPCVRRAGTLLTVVGTMRFDQDDLANLQTSGRLVSVIIHEMAHVLGFGTSWAVGVTQDTGGGADPIYVGSEAIALWPSFNATLQYGGRAIPLENTGGSGTRDAHWRKYLNGPGTLPIFGPELMTGFIELPGVPMPLSKLTIATFKDMGYSVNFGAADAFAGNLLAAPSAAAAPATPLNEQVQQALWEVGPDGRLHRIN